jgi:hypothetical protein
MIGIGGTTTLFQSGRVLAALLFLVGAILLFVFYGLRWFEGKKLPGDAGQWPPIVNTCPDYLTFYKRTKANGSLQNTCIDTLGISKRAGSLSKWPADGSIPTDDRYFFNLDFGISSLPDLNTARCEAAIQAGLTWEGVTDGEVCTFAGAAPTATGQPVTVPQCVP